MDRKRALAAFEDYASAYDPTNPRIALKVDHTMRVADLCERIARGIGLSGDDVDMAWLLGLLHDIGRFEQVRRFDSFNDATTVNHAALGAQVLFEGSADNTEAPTVMSSEDSADTPEAPTEMLSEGSADTPSATAEMSPGASGLHAEAPLVRRFIADPSHDELIRTAVQTHSAYRLPDGLPERTRTLCEVLRDADKVDILKVNCVSPIEDVYNMPEQAMLDSDLSPHCVDIFYQHRCLPRDVRRYPADILLGHICFAWELVYSQSLDIVREQGDLRRMLNRPWNKPATSQAFKEIAQHMNEVLDI